MSPLRPAQIAALVTMVAFAAPSGAKVPAVGVPTAADAAADSTARRLRGPDSVAVGSTAPEAARRAADLAASYEHAIVETLMLRVERALAAEPGARLAIGGGVAANRRLRARAEALGVEVKVPPPELCTDNAAMIGSAARWVDPVPYPRYLALDAYATSRRRRAA